MSLYPDALEETLQARRRVCAWEESHLIRPDQRAVLEAELPVDVRHAGFFLRAVLFLFSAGAWAAFTWLFFGMGDSVHRTAQGMRWLVVAGLAYASAEILCRRFRFYRFGIEEASAIWSVVMLGAAVEQWVRSPAYTPICLTVAVAFAWLHRRFGYLYAALAAFGSIGTLFFHWFQNPMLQRSAWGILALAAFGGLHVQRNRRRETFRHTELSVLRAVAFLALYLAVNVQVRDGMFWPGASNVPPVFYWLTYVLSFVLPLGALGLALRERDRALLDIGLITAIVSLITNKSYLHWPRHPWDPMLLGVALIGAAIGVRRLLRKQDPRWAGMTAERLEAGDKAFVGALGTAAGVLQGRPAAGESAAPHDFGGGRSGGGGASSGF